MKTKLTILISLLCASTLYAKFILTVGERLKDGAQINAYDEDEEDPALLRQKAQEIIKNPLAVLAQNQVTIAHLDNFLDLFSNFVTRINFEHRENPLFMLNECRTETCPLTRKEGAHPFRDNFRQKILEYADYIEAGDLTVIIYASDYLFFETQILLSLLASGKNLRAVILLDQNSGQFLDHLPFQGQYFLDPNGFALLDDPKGMLKHAYLLRQFLDILEEHNNKRRPELYLYTKAEGLAEDLKNHKIPHPQLFLATDFVYDEQSLNKAKKDTSTIGMQLPAGAMLGLLFTTQFPDQQSPQIHTILTKTGYAFLSGQVYIQSLYEKVEHLKENGLDTEIEYEHAEPTSFSARLLQPLWKIWQWTTSWIMPQ